MSIRSIGPWLVLGSLLALGCGRAGTLKTSFDEAYDYSALKTWAFHPEAREYVHEGTRPPDDADGTRYASPEQVNGIMQMVSQRLEEKGYVRAPDTEADFLVGIEGSGVPLTKNTYGYAGPYWARGQDVDNANYEGTLVINIIQREGNQLVWSGLSDGVVLQPERFNETIQVTVDRIMKAFPPK